MRDALTNGEDDKNIVQYKMKKKEGEADSTAGGGTSVQNGTLVTMR